MLSSRIGPLANLVHLMEEDWGIEIAPRLSPDPFSRPQLSRRLVVDRLSPLHRFATHYVAFRAPIRCSLSHLHPRALQSIQQFTITGK